MSFVNYFMNAIFVTLFYVYCANTSDTHIKSENSNIKPNEGCQTKINMN